MSVIMAFITIVTYGGICYAATPMESAIPTADNELPQVCQFSLSKYTGKVLSNGYTQEIKVRLSCPQNDAVRATVGVIIDGELIASQVIKIEANQTESRGVQISVGREYSEKIYRLIVE